MLELTTQLKAATTELEECRLQVKGQADIIKKLDSDVMQKFGIDLELPESGLPLTSVVVDSASQKVPNSGAPHPGETRDGPSGLLQIVVGQRDRFKARMKELENEKQQLDRYLKITRTEVQDLKTDNVALYGKVRYLSNCVGEKAPGNRRPVLDDEETDLRYRKQYEDLVTATPSSLSLGREKDLQGQRLSAPERITLSTTRLVMSTRYGRYGVLIYILVLHLLVMGTLYKVTHRTHMR